MAARRAGLRAVRTGEKPAPAATPRSRRKQKTVAEAAAGGDHRELLVSLRERIAKTVSNPDCPPRDLASLSRRLQELAKEIEAIDMRARQEAGEDGDASDETWDESAI